MNKGGVAAVVFVLPVLEYIFSALPVSSEFGLVIKLPAAFLCAFLVFFFIKQREKSKLIWLTAGGLIALVAYSFASTVLLHHNPLFHNEADNSVIGIWLTEFGGTEMTRNGWSRSVLHNQFGPLEWVLIYSKVSQYCSVLILASLYTLGFSGVLYGFACYFANRQLRIERS